MAVLPKSLGPGASSCPEIKPPKPPPGSIVDNPLLPSEKICAMIASEFGISCVGPPAPACGSFLDITPLGKMSTACTGRFKIVNPPPPPPPPKLAVTLVLTARFEIVQVEPLPEQAPPQPTNVPPDSVNTTVDPEAKVAVQVDPQLIPAGELVTVPTPATVTDTVTLEATAVIVTPAVPDLVGSACDTAVTDTVAGLGTEAGAVYSPLVEIVPIVLLPPIMELTSHVTAVFVVPDSVAENCCVALTAKLADPGVNDTDTAQANIKTDNNTGNVDASNDLIKSLSRIFVPYLVWVLPRARAR